MQCAFCTAPRFPTSVRLILVDSMRLPASFRRLLCTSRGLVGAPGKSSPPSPQHTPRWGRVIELKDIEVAVHGRVRTKLLGYDPNRYIRLPRRLHEPVQLLRHDRRTADRAVQHRLVDDRDQLERGVPLSNSRCRVSRTSMNSSIRSGVISGDSCLVHRPRVVGGLQQPGHRGAPEVDRASSPRPQGRHR